LLISDLAKIFATENALAYFAAAQVTMKDFNDFDTKARVFIPLKSQQPSPQVYK
jgi:hypothetical protein